MPIYGPQTAASNYGTFAAYRSINPVKFSQIAAGCVDCRCMFRKLRTCDKTGILPATRIYWGGAGLCGRLILPVRQKS